MKKKINKKQKPFRNAMLKFGESFLKKLDSYILGGMKGKALKKVAVELYDGRGEMPHVGTIGSYIEWRIQKLKKNSQEIVEVNKRIEIADREVAEQITDLNNITNFDDKKAVLVALLQKVLNRITHLENFMQDNYKISSELYLEKYYKTFKSIMETLIKSSKEMEDNTREVVGEVLNENMDEFMNVIYKTVMIVCPDKKELFRSTLKSQMSKVNLSEKYEIKLRLIEGKYENNE